MKYCEKCGNELIDEATICTKCGCRVKYAKPQSNNENVNQIEIFALVGFIIALVSIFPYVNFFGLLGFSGMTDSIVGLVKCNRKKQRGKGIAIAGIVIGAIMGIFGIYAWVMILHI